MPVRKQMTRVKRINDRIISDLHELILARHTMECRPNIQS